MSRILESIGELINNLTIPLKRAVGPPRNATACVDGTQRDAVLVLDASPSMNGTDWKPSRLAGAKKAAKAFLQTLHTTDPEARVAVVAYDKASYIVSDLQPVQAVREISCGIDSIHTGSWTNIAAGLEAAADLLQTARRNRQVVLLTDGDHNHGPGPEDIAAVLRTRAILECVGIGGDPSEVDEKLLKDIASHDGYGGKRYRWIGDPQQLVHHFQQLATGLTRQP